MHERGDKKKSNFNWLPLAPMGPSLQVGGAEEEPMLVSKLLLPRASSTGELGRDGSDG